MSPDGAVRALVGPWTHGARTVELSYAGDVEFGRDAALPSFLRALPPQDDTF